MQCLQLLRTCGKQLQAYRQETAVLAVAHLDPGAVDARGMALNDGHHQLGEVVPRCADHLDRILAREFYSWSVRTLAHAHLRQLNRP